MFDLTQTAFGDRMRDIFIFSFKNLILVIFFTLKVAGHNVMDKLQLSFPGIFCC
jgi:hypothetical protein